MSETASKAGRILAIYSALRDGKVVNKAQEARRYCVDERSIQRDIDELRAFLAEQTAQGKGRWEVVYDRAQKGFVLTGDQSPIMTNSEILAVSKILLESRAFPKAEMSLVLDKLISGCVPQENMKLVSDLLANEKFHYVELTHPGDIQDRLWEIGQAIRHRELLRLTYRRQDASQPTVVRVVEPVSILFSEYYFYLNAYIVDENAAGRYEHKYDYPAVFRVDRITDSKGLGIRFHLPYASRFQEGEFRKRVQFMYAGGLQRIRFRYTGSSVDAILDRLPTAAIRSQEENGAVIEAEVYGKGILMWLLSQGDAVELLAPAPLREELRKTLRSMLDLYEAD